MDLVEPQADQREEAPSKNMALPPRPSGVHRRSSSGTQKGSFGKENLLAQLPTPSYQIKRAARLEDEREEFRHKSQQFLQSVQHKRPTIYNSPRALRSPHSSCRNSPRKASSLASIGDNDEEEDDHDERTDNSCCTHSSDPPPSTNCILLEGMNSLDDFDDLNTSLVYVDNANEESHCQRHLRFNLEKEQHDKPQPEEMFLKMKDNLGMPNFVDAPNAFGRGKQQSIREYVLELEKERASLIKQWRAEFEAELAEEMARKRAEKQFVLETYLSTFRQTIFNTLATLEIFICNMPLTIAASALSWATLGIVWFKFGAEHLTMYGMCQPVHFHSAINTYAHEFPGSFSCDETSIYKTLLSIHFACHIFAAVLASFFFLKICLAWEAVVDDLTNPVTATPVGVICITLEILFAAAGEAGNIAVLIVAIFHCLFALWYLYVAVVKFKLLPDPSWFPGTVGLGYAAVKAWIVSDVTGKVFLGLSLSFFFGLFFVSTIRVALNNKIAAPVCWMQLSAPSIAFYASTIISQPSASQERMIAASESASEVYLGKMAEYYMPFQHAMFVFCLIGMASSLHSLWTRWDTFKHKPFSPAHLAFGFPTLSHANAIQAYRSAINAFSEIPKTSYFHLSVYTYWIVCLTVGTIINLILTYMALTRLPEWTNINITGEDEPPKPSETIMSEMLHDAHEVIDQPFVSPAVLQANETGTLIRVRRGTEDFRRHGPYIRTRHVASLGFDPTLSLEELREERARLFDWVARNAPRTRNRTLSIPIFLHLKDNGVQGIYGTFDGTYSPLPQRHRRSQTMGDIK